MVSAQGNIVATPSGGIGNQDLLLSQGNLSDPFIELTASQGDIIIDGIDGTIRSGFVDTDGTVRIKAGGILRVNGSTEFTDGSSVFHHSIFADSNQTFTDRPEPHLIQIKVGNEILVRQGPGTPNGPGAKLLIEVGKGPFTSGRGRIPAGESGTVDLIHIFATNGGPVTSFQGRLFGSPDSSTPDSPTPDSPTPPTTLAAQTLEYDDEAGEEDSEEACSPADPACRPDEAAAVLPKAPTR